MLVGVLLLLTFLVDWSNATTTHGHAHGHDHASLASRSISNTTINECTDPQPNNCTFYPLCLETRYHCGPSGYPLGYGLKYCTKFSADRAELSAAGQAWMEHVMLCLQRKLVPYADGAVQNSNVTCEEIKEYAFSTHPGCYVHSGLCTLPVSDWEAIVSIVTIPQLFGSLEAFEATVEAAVGCAEFYLWMVERGIF
ncbi:hypothetical protein VTN77DRAFT_2051 [Rasamsonia byssochlamydoides]|uniref:uncharacterized protein n=1 Tax=Rasamsonia byssochlamydoides TaxID=89139 RepID=UPI003742F3B5